MRKTRTNAAHRKALLGKAAIGVKQLGIDADTLREMLRNLFGRESRAELTAPQLVLLCDHLAQRGARFTSGAAPREGKPYKVKAAGRRSDWYEIPEGPQAARKRGIAAMWRRLGYDMTSLDTRVQRAFGVEAFRWLDDEGNLRTLARDLEARLRAREQREQDAAEATA